MKTNHIVDVLTKCAAYDPIHFPKPSDAMLDAWCEHFGQYPKLTPDDALDAVKLYYNQPSRPVPQPADISRIARDIHQDHVMRDENYYTPDALPPGVTAVVSAADRAKLVAEINRALKAPNDVDD